MQVVGYAQSIIGATEKRRESGAGCRGIWGIWIRGVKVGEFIRIRQDGGLRVFTTCSCSQLKRDKSTEYCGLAPNFPNFPNFSHGNL